MRLYNPCYLLPSLILFGVLTLGLRVDEVWQVATGKAKLSMHTARAAETKSDAPPAVTTPAPASTEKSSEKPAEAAKGPEIEVPPMPSPEADAADDTSPAEREVLKQLSSRREILDKRAHVLDTREALIKVGEQRVDQKIKEMESLRLQLQSMVDQINGAQQTQLANLVKIYETMKPQEAAKIFETLDMPVLLGVIQRMKPKSTAPIMAAMAPEKAKEVTIALTKQDQLPQEKPAK